MEVDADMVEEKLEEEARRRRGEEEEEDGEEEESNNRHLAGGECWVSIAMFDYRRVIVLKVD